MSKILIEKELGAVPTEIEIEVVDILVNERFVTKHVKFLKPSREQGSKTPDIEIDNSTKWEIKSITKDGKYTLEHALRSGLAQSNNLIVDIRKLKIPVQKKYVQKIEQQYLRRKSWTGAVVVIRSQKASGILTLSK